MRTITKLPEPPCLAQLRAQPGAVFDDRGLESAPHVESGNPMLSSACKQTLREQLWKEQRGLCCYCCNGIVASEDGMRIEHWKPLKRFPEHQLEYWNLMAACPGNEGQEGLEHCDVCKGNQDLSKNPSNPQHRLEEAIHYLNNGEVRSTDSQFDSELGENPRVTKRGYERVLNLNVPFLRQNRIGVLTGFTTGLAKRGALDRPALERLVRKWSGTEPGQLEAFAPVVVWWLTKRLNRA
jgi:uncharacterized protein (TIGR02646 family)